MTTLDLGPVVAAARACRAHAYAPYSKYPVGAALLTARGRIFAGCNIENASFGATLCAERSAVAAMVGAGESRPVACAVVTRGPRPAAPCGICRQVLSEFARDMTIVLVAEDDRGIVTSRRRASLRSLLPRAFRGPV